jgi:hypothetical protein
MRVVWVDVESPVLNVYNESLIVDAPTVGAVHDFGLASPNSMSGAWWVLSVERPWIDGAPDPRQVRVNVIRPWRLTPTDDD